MALMEEKVKMERPVRRFWIGQECSLISKRLKLFFNNILGNQIDDSIKALSYFILFDIQYSQRFRWQ